MSILSALPLLTLLACGEGEGWKQEAREDGVTVQSRAREGSSVTQVKAIGMIDAPPHEVWRVLRDYDHYVGTMPYTKEAKVLATQDGGKVLDVYSLIAAPMVDKRDYIIRITDVSDWKEGKGYLKMVWTAVEGPVPEKSGVVRVKRNEGCWLLEPREDGKKTFATYFLDTDPGGSLPNWAVNMANKTSVPSVFKVLRQQAKK